jgi:hypothetical protein
LAEEATMQQRKRRKGTGATIVAGALEDKSATSPGGTPTLLG